MIERIVHVDQVSRLRVFSALASTTYNIRHVNYMTVARRFRHPLNQLQLISTSTDTNANPGRAPPSQKCPSEWFICDHTASGTRIVVIQGTNSLDHWKLNLQFDPVPLAAAAATHVHRGSHELAMATYREVAPFIRQVPEHITRFCFTGHSVGGSVATLLAVMLIMNGDLDRHSIDQVATFGAPAVFCSPPIGADMWGLPYSAIQNVMLPLDIVPRAFSCNYRSVRPFLYRMHPRFRTHASLMREAHPQLYHMVGNLYMLHPDPKLQTLGDGGGGGGNTNAPFHPVFPQEPGLFSVSMTDTKRLRRIMNDPHPLRMLATHSVGSLFVYHNSHNYSIALKHVLQKLVAENLMPQSPTSKSPSNE